MDLLYDLIGEGEIGDASKTSAREQAFNSDIERLTMDVNAHVKMIKAGGSKSEPMYKNILEYWNRFRYGALSKLADLACDLLVIPASSVPSERLFSIAGLLSSGIILFYMVDNLWLIFFWL